LIIATFSASDHARCGIEREPGLSGAQVSCNQTAIGVLAVRWQPISGSSRTPMA
jgi:hypothetical protein